MYTGNNNNNNNDNNAGGRAWGVGRGGSDYGRRGRGGRGGYLGRGGRGGGHGGSENRAAGEAGPVFTTRELCAFATWIQQSMEGQPQDALWGPGFRYRSVGNLEGQTERCRARSQQRIRDVRSFGPQALPFLGPSEQQQEQQQQQQEQEQQQQQQEQEQQQQQQQEQQGQQQGQQFGSVPHRDPVGQSPDPGAGSTRPASWIPENGEETLNCTLTTSEFWQVLGTEAVRRQDIDPQTVVGMAPDNARWEVTVRYRGVGNIKAKAVRGRTGARKQRIRNMYFGSLPLPFLGGAQQQQSAEPEPTAGPSQPGEPGSDI